MTFEEWQRAHYIKLGFISSIDELRMAWDAAVAAERDRCAKLCESVASEFDHSDEDAQALSIGAQSCAYKIRAGS